MRAKRLSTAVISKRVLFGRLSSIRNGMAWAGLSVLSTWPVHAMVSMRRHASSPPRAAMLFSTTCLAVSEVAASRAGAVAAGAEIDQISAARAAIVRIAIALARRRAGHRQLRLPEQRVLHWFVDGRLG